MKRLSLRVLSAACGILLMAGVATAGQPDANQSAKARVTQVVAPENVSSGSIVVTDGAKKRVRVARQQTEPVIPFAADGSGLIAFAFSNDDFLAGLCNMSLTSGSFSFIKSYDDSWQTIVPNYDNVDATFAGGNKYVVCSNGKYTEFNTQTGEKGATGTLDPANRPTAWSYDFNERRIYGCFGTASNGYVFGWMDPSTYQLTKISDIASTAVWKACATSPDGRIYAVRGDGKILRVTKTGYITEVGNTGISSSMTYRALVVNWNTGDMYLAAEAPDTEYESFYSVNQSSGKATCLISTYGYYNSFVGFYFPYESATAVEYAPSAPTNATIVTSPTSLAYQVRFTAPSTNLDGAAGSGSLTYKISINGVESKTGTTNYGSNVSATFSAPEAGIITASITVANSTGESQPAEVSSWVGPDQPLAPQNAKLEYANGTFTLTWDPSTGSVHGGTFNATSVTYNVYEYGTGALVASGLTTTSFTKTIAIPDSPVLYYFMVEAVYSGQVSEKTQSNSVYAGGYTVPWTENFNSEELGLNKMVVVNGGDPDYTWMWVNDRARMPSWGHQACDDWLITPPIHLQPGVEYIFRMDILCGGSGPNANELVSVSYGPMQTAEAMTTQLIPVTKVDYNNFRSLNKSFTVATAGDYCFGIRSTSGIHVYMEVDNVTIRTAADYQAPAAARNLTITPDPNGALAALVSFETPAVDIVGDPIDIVDRIDIYRNDVLIHTITNAIIATTINYTDNSMTEANYFTYKVVCSNAKGSSPEVTSRRYVGINLPASIANVTVSEPTVGTALLSWTPVTTDVDGYPLSADLISYDIRDNESNLVGSNIKGTTYSYVAVAPGEAQKYINFTVIPRTTTGQGTPTNTGAHPFGEPTACPYYESFANGTLTNTFALGVSMGAGSFETFFDNEAYQSQDEDFGMLCIEGTGRVNADESDVISLYSGKIKVSGDKPALSFYYYGQGMGGTNSIDVNIERFGTGIGFVSATPTSITTNATNGWTRVVIPLSEYKGTVIRFAIVVTNVLDRYTFFDNIRIEDLVDNDLVVYDFETPAETIAGDLMVATVAVQNVGENDANGWTAVLYRNGDKVDQRAGMLRKTGELCLVRLYDRPGVNIGDECTYKVNIEWDADNNKTNNLTGERTVRIIQPEWPVVENLSGSLGTSGYTLTWQAPVGEEDTPTTETFEDMDAWSPVTFGGWRTYDVDNLKILGIVNTDMPVAGSPQGHFIFDATVAPDPSTLAHSGTKASSSMGSSRGDCEDWLVSPVLNGKEQTISFWIKHYSNYESDKFYQIMTSSTDAEMESFAPLSGTFYTPADWTLQTASLPEGTKYFAIRTINPLWTAMVLIDDITYTPGKSSTSDLEGYNVYRDGVKLNTELIPASTTSFVDSNVDAANESHSYFVTAVYGKGESAKSNTVGFNAGIDNVTADSAIEIEGRHGEIVVIGAGALQVDVTTTTGATLWSGKATDELSIKAQPDIYIVKAGATIKKVVVM